jgi:hypothetical protein
MICSHPKSPSEEEPWAISPSENEGHQVWNKQIGLPQNKQTRVKIDLKLVHRGFVTDRRLDTGNFNLKSVVLWIVMRKPYDKKRKGPIPAWFRIRIGSSSGMGSGWLMDVGVGILYTSHTTIAYSTMIASCPSLE